MRQIKSCRANNGVTLVELMVAMFILAIAAYLGSVGVNFLADLMRQRAMIEAERDAQVTLYNVARDIRNSSAILDISSGTVSFKMPNVRGGYSTATNANLFNTFLFVTYDFIPAGTSGYLERKVTLGGNVVEVSKLLVNQLRPVTVDDYIFKDPHQPLGAPPPYDSVEIVFRLKPAFNRGNAPIFRAESMTRSPG